ncbi:hypothetical protein DFH28DRAFT_1087200 [Melampsora americana]|nr:hypothetical protein DFH28DRAFT_1087200 [Melampsora americana]
MVLPGERIEPPHKRAKPAERAPKTDIGRQLATTLANEAQGSQARLNSLNTPPPEPVPKQNIAEEPEQDQIYDAMIQPEDNPDDHPPPEINRAEYYRSVTYQERRMREEAEWKSVMPAITLAFMPCSRLTFQWADPTLWDHDFNKPCTCPAWKKKNIKVDAIDFVSRIKKNIQVCQCTPDVVWLVRQGCMGNAPKVPRTAFSIRLLRFHHILWKHCSVGLAPFVTALDEYLDAHNPLLVVSGTDKSRDWLDAFRKMIRFQDELTCQALQLSPKDQLAMTCPPCFGPIVPGKRATEPNVIICLNGNFQHRRHKAARAGWRGETGVIPSRFLPLETIKLWETKMALNRAGPNDIVTFAAYDKSGLMGMACRHDQILQFINIIQSGERGHFPVAMLDWLLKRSESNKKIGVLYDIGCNMEKGILKCIPFICTPMVMSIAVQSMSKHGLGTV